MEKTRKIKSSKSGKSRTRFAAKCGARNTDTNYTCYDSETLHKLKTLWNARHPDAKIQTQDDKEIWKALKENMSNVCNTEKCWLRQNFSKHNISEDLRLYTFAPNSPKSWLDNPNEWLSSVDIEKVMNNMKKNIQILFSRTIADRFRYSYEWWWVRMERIVRVWFERLFGKQVWVHIQYRSSLF